LPLKPTQEKGLKALLYNLFKPFLWIEAQSAD